MPYPLPDVPAACPECEHRSLQVQVTTWWQCVAGQPSGQGDDYIEVPHDAYAICDECHHQWRVFP